MWPDENGDWSTGNAYEEPRTDTTIATDIASTRQDVDSSGTGSSWGGWLQSAAGKVLDYGLKRDAAQSTAQLQAQRQQALATQPLVSTSNGTIGVNPMGLMLIVGLVLIVGLAKKG